MRDLSLWDKRDAKIMTLSGSMKRRVLIAKALSHEPKILFPDEPSAGVDVELRHDMWRMGTVDGVSYGAFYSISMLPPLWQKITLFNPVVYLISGFRWSFYGIADVHIAVSTGITLAFLAICLITVWWIFKTGYKLRS